MSAFCYLISSSWFAERDLHEKQSKTGSSSSQITKICLNPARFLYWIPSLHPQENVWGHVWATYTHTRARGRGCCLDAFSSFSHHRLRHLQVAGFQMKLRLLHCSHSSPLHTSPLALPHKFVGFAPFYSASPPASASANPRRRYKIHGLCKFCRLSTSSKGDSSKNEGWFGRLERVLDSLNAQSFQSACTTYSDLLRSCSNPNAFPKGRHIHRHILRRGVKLPRYMGNMLVSMYGKCEALDYAERTFCAMPDRDVISWTAMITAYVHNGRAKAALQLFEQMLRERVEPNKVTFVSVVNACGRLKDGFGGKHLHGLIEQRGFVSDVVVGTALVNMYGKCGCMADAKAAFLAIQQRNVVSWTTLLVAYADNGLGREALHSFEEMQKDGIKPDKVTLVSVLNVCASPDYLQDGKAIHNQIVAAGLERDLIVGNALINMYCKCRSLEGAYRMFDAMPDRDVISWTSMITAFAQEGEGSRARQLFWQMPWEGAQPNPVTLLAVLDACVRPQDLTEGKLIHAYVLHCGFESDVILQTALVNMYGRCGSLGDALKVFQKMPDRNIVSWTALISAYAQHGDAISSLHCLGEMQLEGIEPDKILLVSVLDACANKGFLLEGSLIHACILDRGFESDLIVGNAIINMYGKCGSTNDARKVFDKMPVRDVVSWSALLGAYVQQGYGRKALEAFQQMECDDIKPDKVTLISMLDACANLACLVEGQNIHNYVISNGFESDIVVGNALVNMYSKCGTLEDSRLMFERMACRDVITWNALIAACAQHGDGISALQLLGHMQLEGATPDKVTLISILTACSHAGLVDNGCHIFMSIDVDQDMVLTLEHYGCIIDLLGRAGELEDAEKLIRKMPYTPNAVVLNTLLGACRIYGDIDRGRRIADCLSELHPENPLPYVTLSNIYADKGLWTKVTEVRKEMVNRCAMKEPGISSTRLPSLQFLEQAA